MTTAILQLGTGGQLARAMIGAARGDIALTALPRAEADFTRPDELARAVGEADKLDVVVNAAAYTAVDKAESETDLARQVNAVAVERLARACAARGVPLIHVSTDYVFDGTKPSPYRESDAVNPLSVYGRTKLEGEDHIRAVLPAHVILRTSWVYSAQGGNFVKTMLRLGAERDELRVVDDQRGAPTAAGDLAEAIVTVAGRLKSGVPEGGFGTFHYTGGGETTWRKFAERIFAQAQAWAGAKARVIPIATAAYPTPARRPLNSRLDCTRIAAVYGIEPIAWTDALDHVLEELKALRNAA